MTKPAFRLDIDMDTAAFDAAPMSEVARILRTLADWLEHVDAVNAEPGFAARSRGFTRQLLDSNETHVGMAVYEER
jgi:hypothetical protein